MKRFDPRAYAGTRQLASLSADRTLLSRSTLSLLRSERRVVDHEGGPQGEVLRAEEVNANSLSSKRTHIECSQHVTG